MIITWWRRTGTSVPAVPIWESWGYFSDNRTMFIMSMPLASIQESVALSNRFTTWGGPDRAGIGSIVMCFGPNRITKPIMKLSSLSEEMSRLNFDASYEDDGGMRWGSGTQHELPFPQLKRCHWRPAGCQQTAAA